MTDEPHFAVRRFAIDAKQAYALATAWTVADNEGLADTEVAGIADLVEAMRTWAEANGGAPPPRPPRRSLADVEEVEIDQ